MIETRCTAISSHPDWEELTYAEIIKTFLEEDNHVNLPRIVIGKEATRAFDNHPRCMANL